MPYIDSTPKDYPMVFEEDNLTDVFGQMLIDNGWTHARTFYKAVVDTRAYFRITDRVNYAVAKHSIFRNADGKLLGVATVGQFDLKFRRENSEPIRRPNDDIDPSDVNFGMTPSWDVWVKQKFANTDAKTNLYFYMLEKLPNDSLAPNGSVVSIVTMPGMSNTAYDVDRDRDRENWRHWWYGYHYNEVYQFDDDPNDLKYDGKVLSASPYHVIRSALDIEVLGTGWDGAAIEAYVTHTDPRCMQSPIVKTTLRAEFLENVTHPIWHTNWWTDSEVSVRGHVDSRTIFLIMQADNAPTWEKNLVPTIPLYFGKINSLDGDKDEGYALFAGTIPPASRTAVRNEVTRLSREVYPNTTTFKVVDATKLPDPPALLTLQGKEVIKLVQKEGNTLTVERAQQGTEAGIYGTGTTVARLSTNNANIPNETVVSLYDFDDPGATVGETIQPLLKVYPYHPSNGVDSVMVSRSRFGARYQAHYLSWNAPPNQIPPTRMTEDGRKYPRAFESMENTTNYKYQFNASRYSGKIHSSRIFVIHPEEGVRGYLDKAIGFNPQSISSSTKLRVRKENCPEKVYEMYKYFSVGAVSPITKIPATPFRQAGLGIYMEDFNPQEVPHDITNDTTPASEVTITKAVSPEVETIDIEFTLPLDKDLKHVNIYVDGKLYAKGITRTTFYRIAGLTTGFTPEIKITTVDLAGNESVGVIAPSVTVV
ncbi:hypothetical protein [Metabacillus fastidiosus]|uniref:hypothetical protein n=1 Tax=Metabacillus fastidiosus TaxID=1458 RepID=UPI003D2A3F64